MFIRFHFPVRVVPRWAQQFYCVCETWNRPGEMSAAVSKALRQVEKVQQKQVQSQLITSCDWMLWEKMLSSFGKLETGERLEFVQELSSQVVCEMSSLTYPSSIIPMCFLILYTDTVLQFYCYICIQTNFVGNSEMARKFIIANDDQSWSGRFKKQTTQTMPCDDAWALCFWPASPWPPAKNCRRQQLLQIKHILVMPVRSKPELTWLAMEVAKFQKLNNLDWSEAGSFGRFWDFYKRHQQTVNAVPSCALGFLLCHGFTLYNLFFDREFESIRQFHVNLRFQHFQHSDSIAARSCSSSQMNWKFRTRSH